MKKPSRILSSAAAISAILALAACSSGPVPKGVKIGKPYSVSGKTYYPAYDPTYDETGIASWYGPGFHGSSTANGEQFDTHDLTCAHPTLPMPSMVRVTNLENGKTLVVRVNDRGPFAEGRIVDLSKEAAKRLGIKGLAKVRVQYLRDESEQYIAAVNEGRRIDMFAYNDKLEQEKNASILAATAPSDQSFIIEANDNQTRPGDTVSNAAPILSVSNADLPPPSGAPKKSRGIIVRDAMADDSVPAAASQRGGPVVLTSPNIDPAVDAADENMVVVKETTPSGRKPKIATGSGSVIQVGSFSQQANAEKMQDMISSIASGHITKVNVGGNEWWRLQAGPFSNHEEAMEALEKIRAQAPDARIIKQ